ncbi:MAG: DUF3971 domain-containing protein [Paracoccaceae bacterium]
MLVSIVLLSGLLFLAGMSLSGRIINAPNWVAARFVDRVNAGIANGHITLGRLQFKIESSGVPKIFLGDLGVFDARGAEIVRLNDVQTSFSVAALFEQEIRAETINLSGAQMTLRRLVDGRFDVSFGSGLGTTGTLPDVLDMVDAAFLNSPLDKVQFLTANDLTITLEDARSGRLWQITEGSMQIRREETGLDISVAFDVFNGTEELAETTVGIRTKFGSSEVSIGTSFKNATSGDIAIQSPVLSFLGVLNAPISGALRADFGVDGILSTLAGTLEMGEGALQPAAGVVPVPFTSAKAYFYFDPELQKINFTEVSVESTAVSLVAQGHAYLNDFKSGWPSVLVGQFTLSNLNAHPENVFANSVSFQQGAADFRMNLSPFSVEFGQIVLADGDEKIVADGRVSTGSDGWTVQGDINVSEIGHQKLLSIWPLEFSPNTRNWLQKKLSSAVLSDIDVAVRIQPGMPIRRHIGWKFRDLSLRYINAQPEITKASGYATIEGDTLTLVIEDGVIAAPDGGDVKITNATVQIPDFTVKAAPISVSISGNSTATAALSLLNAPPFKILRNASFDSDVADGRVDFDASVGFRLRRIIGMDEVSYKATARLSDIHSDRLIPGRALSANSLQLTADNDGVEIAGKMNIGKIMSDILWHQKTGQGKSSRVTGTVELSQAFVEEFNIGLPKGAVTGVGIGQFELLLNKDVAPSFVLTSDLNRVGIQIRQIGWVKPKNSSGSLSVAGTLGAQPSIEKLEIQASGLNATGGRVALGAGGAMETARFARLRVGGWLDAPVILRGRGPGAVPSVHLQGGTIDIRKTAFAGKAATSAGAGGPITLALERVIVSQGIVLTDFVGDFDSASGLSGNFTARMNGKTPLTGRLVPEANGTAIRIQSTNAGALLRNAGVVQYAENGSLDLVLRPRPQNGVYEGNLQINSTNVRNAPGMTELLSAISIVGLLEQLGGTGILFEDVSAEFLLTPTSVRLVRSSAVGPSLGVSLDGVYDLETSTMNMQGVVSPVYFLNGIGQIFSRRGEGLFGFNFKLRGSSTEPKVSVNPLSILTPGVFRDIFRSPPPETN